MPVDDRFKVAVVSELDGVNIINLFYHQVVQSAADDLEDTELLNWWENNAIPAIAEFISDAVTFTCITARRLAPGLTSTETRFINVSGDQTGDFLPSTVFAMVRYWCNPFERGQRNHWKFGGIPESGHAAGLITDTYRSSFQTFIDLVNAGTFVPSAGYEFSWIRAVPPGAPQVDDAPQIDELDVAPKLSNTRSRQFRVCTG